MKCPACGDKALEAVTVGDVTVDVCKDGCGGVWFDTFEVKKLDEPHEHADEVMELIEGLPTQSAAPTEKRPCPRCDGIKMMRHFFSINRQVEADECGGCGGYWLDAGELRKIREQYDTAEAREAAAKAYFDEIFGEQLAEMKKGSEQQLASARRIAHMFRFICPSYYIPGDQEWGAF